MKEKILSISITYFLVNDEKHHKFKGTVNYLDAEGKNASLDINYANYKHLLRRLAVRAIDKIRVKIKNVFSRKHKEIITVENYNNFDFLGYLKNNA